jgi:sulfonate transport system substrate-binding protein
MLARRLVVVFGAILAAGALAMPAAPAAAQRPDTVTLDWAYYNPVSLVVKQQGWLEEELAASRRRGSASAGCRAWARTRRSSS